MLWVDPFLFHSALLPDTVTDGVFFDMEANFWFGRLGRRRRGMKKEECRMQNTPEAVAPERNPAEPWMIQTLMTTARGLLSMLAAMSAPCSVNATGSLRRPP